MFRDEKGREYKVIGKRGTSKTWHNYQHLSDLIFRGERTSSDGIIDFHRHIFTTELSDAAALTSKDPNKSERLASIEARKEFFRNDFFKTFPIILIAAGDYPKRFGVNFDTFWGPVSEVEIDDRPFTGIYKIVRTQGEQCKLFMQTYQLSMVSSGLIKEIADRIIEFKNNHNITLV